MSLDFHLSKTEKEAPFAKSVKRLQDYYSDARFDLKEIPTLIEELEKLKNHFSGNDQLVQQLKDVYGACSSAIKNDMSMWVYCD